MSERMEEGMEKIKVLNFKEWMHREDYGDPRQLERAFNQGMKYMGQIVEDEYIEASGDSALQHINAHKWEVGQLESRIASLESDLRQAKVEVERLEAKRRLVYEDRTPWPEELKRAVIELENRFDREMVSIEHHERWVDMCEKAESSLARFSDNEKLMMDVAVKVRDDIIKESMSHKIGVMPIDDEEAARCKGYNAGLEHAAIIAGNLDMPAIVAAVMEGKGERLPNDSSCLECSYLDGRLYKQCSKCFAVAETASGKDKE